MARVSTPSRRAALRLSPRMASPVRLGSGSQSAGEGGRSACRVPHARSVDCVDCPRLLLLSLSLLLLSMPVGWRRHLSAYPLPRMRGNNPIDGSRWGSRVTVIILRLMLSTLGDTKDVTAADGGWAGQPVQRDSRGLGST